MEKDDFTIKIHEGFGRFKFGSTPGDNEKIAPIYGGVLHVNETYSREYWLTLIEETDDKELIDRYKNILNTCTGRNLKSIWYNGGISCFYIQNKLYGVGVNIFESPIYYEDIDISGGDTRYVIDYFCNNLKEPALINEDDIYFKDSFISFGNFSRKVENKKVLWVKKNSYEFENRTFSISAGDRNDAQDYKDYFIYSPS